MKKILIIKTGGTFADFAAAQGDFEHWTVNGMGIAPDQWECVNVQTGEHLPDPAGYAGCVLTGSHDMVTDRSPWMMETEAWIRRSVDAGLPMLGICFGHQIMADALGGEAGFHPEGLEMGTVDIYLTEEGSKDALLGPLSSPFKANMAHSQTVLKLPENAVLLAKGTHEPHQCFRVGKHAWGIQFHPEFNTDVIRMYEKEQRKRASAAGGDTDSFSIVAEDTPEVTSILKRFAAYCLGC
eukprot:TRINITY_DN10970_c0_g3_i1.p2 TRINITY_DN10970_c0_g3~~TRINITY_DN10970_c0_g3_i1.p2  ORF type:complete len:239 (+),score=50.51 TRINITY_DN10970_c0_g3_i1:137-853(+)